MARVYRPASAQQRRTFNVLLSRPHKGEPTVDAAVLLMLSVQNADYHPDGQYILPHGRRAVTGQNTKTVYARSVYRTHDTLLGARNRQTSTLGRQRITSSRTQRIRYLNVYNNSLHRYHIISILNLYSASFEKIHLKKKNIKFIQGNKIRVVILHRTDQFNGK